MAFLDAFRDWLNQTCDFQLEQTIKDPTTGQITKSWNNVQAGVKFAIYANNSQETNVNDKFVNQKILTAIFDPATLTITPTISHRILFNGDYYYIEGDNDIQFYNEVLELKLRKEYHG